METKELLMTFSKKDGTEGRGNVAAYAAEALSPYGKQTISPLGSVLCQVRPPEQGRPYLLLEARIDEAALIVTAVDAETGFLRVDRCGRIDRRLLSAARVLVHTASGPLPGTICPQPPLLSRNGEKKNPRVDEVYIDTGLSAGKSGRTVSIGDMVTLQSEPRELLGGLVSGKAMGGRAGCAACLKALEYLDGVPLDCGLTVLFSMGEQGAGTGAYTVDPTHALVVNSSFAQTPDAGKEGVSELRKGPAIVYSPILSLSASRQLAGIARERGIPWQAEVIGTRTGADADSIAMSRGGVAAAMLSIPLRYKYTPVETAAVCDVENTARLIAEYGKENWGRKGGGVNGTAGNS